MGLNVSYMKIVLESQSTKEKCYPLTPYLPFPHDRHTVGADGLVIDMHVLPAKLHRATDHDNSWFWWCDAQFLPFNDAQLFASASAYQPRQMRHWISVAHMPNGRVLFYDVADPDRIKCQVYSRTNSTVFPKVQPHPIGPLVGYCGTGEVAVISSNGDPVFSRSRDLSNSVHVYCAIAPNGVSFACLKRGAGVFFLETSCLDRTMIGLDSLRCHTLCPGFVPSRTRNDHVAIKFSPDSKHIAVGGGNGYFFIIQRVGLKKVAIVCPEIVEDALSSAQAFDYHPHYPYEILSCATRDRHLYTLHVDNAEIIVSTRTEEVVDCMKYSPDGHYLAVGLHNFDILLFNSEDLASLHTFPMSNLCTDETSSVYPYYPAVLNLSFSQNSMLLASTACDGRLRVWKVPKLPTLQECCRDVILSAMAVRHAKKLEVPQKVIDFLLYKHF